MADIPKIVLPHGGYKKLIVYRKSDVIYQGTVAFCRRFLSRLDSATDAAQLALMADEIKRKVDQTVWGIRKRKGWQ